MSEWAVNLEFVEGGSSKFWRARVDGGVLYVNFGKIGTGGQVQMKDLGSPDAAAKEMDKLIREKRKKGYEDAGSAGSSGADEEEEEDEEEDDEPPPKKAAPKAAAPVAPTPIRAVARSMSVDLVLQSGGRRIVTKATLDGTTVSVQSTESHADADAAFAAFERLRAALAADGHAEG